MSEQETTILCRCSDVTQERVRELIAEGYTTFDEIKRLTRAGMGPCQGKTCQQLILRELALALGKPIGELTCQTTRPPAVGVPLYLIAKEANGHVDNG